MTLRDSLHQCQQTLRELQAAIKTRRDCSGRRPRPCTARDPSFGFNPSSPEPGLRDLQAIDDIQDYLRDSLVEIKPGDFDALRDQLIDRTLPAGGPVTSPGEFAAVARLAALVRQRVQRQSDDRDATS